MDKCYQGYHEEIYFSNVDTSSRPIGVKKVHPFNRSAFHKQSMIPREVVKSQILSHAYI